MNRWTISTPIKNINQSPISDIAVDVSFTKQGRKVEELYFIVKPRYQELPTLSSLVDAPSNVDASFSIAKVTISNNDQKVYLETYSPEQIRASIERANEYGADLEAKGKSVNYGAIYKIAIEENWGEQYLQQKALTNQSEQKAINKSEEKLAQTTDAKIIDNDEVWHIFAQLPAEEQDKLRNEYISQESVAFKKIWKETLKKQELPEKLLTFQASFTKFLLKKLV